MIIDEVRPRQVLHRIVCGLTSDTALREDLIQEAMVHLWLLEERRPAQSPSWYLQNCKFHLQNHIAAGKSVDSLKRKRGRVSFSSDSDDTDEFVNGNGNAAESNGTEFAQLNAQDIISLLAPRLKTVERSVLLYLADGLSARDIAARLKVSHPTVIKHRRKIAALATRLGIPPPPQYQRNRNRETSPAK